jgi:hypothetical protein
MLLPLSLPRSPPPSPSVQAYKQDPVFIKTVEDQFLDFLCGKAPA